MIKQYNGDEQATTDTVHLHVAVESMWICCVSFRWSPPLFLCRRCYFAWLQSNRLSTGIFLFFIFDFHLNNIGWIKGAIWALSMAVYIFCVSLFLAQTCALYCSMHPAAISITFTISFPLWWRLATVFLFQTNPTTGTGTSTGSSNNNNNNIYGRSDTINKVKAERSFTRK